MDEPQITWHDHSITREQRESLNGHRGCVVWFTGLSGSGKSTIANGVDQKLHQRGVHTFVLDGDNVRHGLNASTALLAEFGEQYAERFGLGFSALDRQENIRRVGAVSELFAAAGLVTLVAFVSPYQRDREAVRSRIEASLGEGDFIEVHVDASLEVCESRDPKGLYQKARAGEITGMTGIDDPYEPPQNPELHLDAGDQNPDALAEQVVTYLQQCGVIEPS
ncbi:MAG: adenylyl-sulfate kinase [Planctomycetota bacterium]|nr:adenylyl-sulfate kinase [Planctomycetota bacterium]